MTQMPSYAAIFPLLGRFFKKYHNFKYKREIPTLPQRPNLTPQREAELPLPPRFLLDQPVRQHRDRTSGAVHTCDAAYRQVGC